MKVLCLAIGLLGTYSQIQAASILYGGVGRGSPTNSGALVTVDQTTGAGIVIGNATGASGLTGLVFDPLLGIFFGTGNTDETFEGGTSQLYRINAGSGSAIGSPINITAAGLLIVITDLALQPSTGFLYGNYLNTTNFTNTIYRIDKATGVATVVGNTGRTGATLAFSPGGVLYMTTAEFDMNAVFLRGFLNTVDPSTGAILTTSSPFTTAHVGGLAVRPEDGVIFASGGRPGDIYTLSTSGTQTLVGITGVGGVGDLAFAPVPEPATLLTGALAAFMLFASRRRHLN
jgi:hypothetical protein